MEEDSSTLVRKRPRVLRGLGIEVLPAEARREAEPAQAVAQGALGFVQPLLTREGIDGGERGEAARMLRHEPSEEVVLLPCRGQLGRPVVLRKSVRQDGERDARRLLKLEVPLDVEEVSHEWGRAWILAPEMGVEVDDHQPGDRNTSRPSSKSGER